LRRTWKDNLNSWGAADAVCLALDEWDFVDDGEELLRLKDRRKTADVGRL
jgi:hypothetical protein